VSNPGNESWEPRRRPSVVPGAILTLLGAAGLAVVLAADIGGTPALEALAFRLGLAWGPLLLGVSQVLFLVGVWLLWRALRRPDQPPE
jgi:hypothetical protein